jgi:hypothetical protein
MDELKADLLEFGLTSVLYRPTIVGHTACLSVDVPARSESELAPITYEDNYGWPLFPTFNRMWQDMLQAAGESRPRGYLPIYHRSVLRPE